MKKSALLIITLLFTFVNINAQSSQLEQRVSFHYVNTQLGAALTDISNNYQVHFSYSSDFVPVHQFINAEVQDELLTNALTILFSETQIVFAFIGNQIALRVDTNKKQESLSQLDKNRILIKMKKDPVLSRNPVVEEETQSILVKAEEPENSPDTIHYDPQRDQELAILKEKEEALKKEEAPKELEFEPAFSSAEEWRQRIEAAMKPSDDRRVAQISIIPNVSTTATNGAEITNHLSFNLLWGLNGGVQGMEVGGFVNNVTHDVTGFQVAGLGNKVGHNVIGTQVGGLFNHNTGTTKGLQAAGIFNYSGNADAAQAAGFANVVSGDLGGMQASGIFNKVTGNSNALQAAGIFNVSGGKAKVQIGGLFNVAKDVEVGQVSSLINVAQEVKGFQIGFINVSDTVSGVPIGLINIVKKGYNKLDIYGGELLHLNISLKLGARAFYNIFHIGARIPGQNRSTWGLGYGIGTMSKISKQRFFNLEAMIIHVNEKDPWTTNLNMIGHFRILHHWKIGSSTSFFFGPTLNLMVSTLRNEETGEVGSSLTPYTLFNSTANHKTNYKGWIGVNAGFRF